MHLFWTIFEAIMLFMCVYACMVTNIPLIFGTTIAIGIYSMCFITQAINMSERYPHMMFHTFAYLFFVKGYNNYGI